MRHFLQLTIVFASIQASFAQAWELKKDNEGIQVYTRTVSKSPVKEYKVVARIPAGAAKILVILKNVPDYPQWINDVMHTKTVTQSANRMSFYYQMNLPWPAKDRDLCMDMHISSNDERTTVRLSSNPDLVPVDDDFIRIILVEGQWVITAIDDNNTIVEQQFLADPAGSLPKWIVNMFLVDSPFQTMKNLQEYVKD